MFKTLKTRPDKPAQMGQPKTIAPIQTLNSTVLRQTNGQSDLPPVSSQDALLPMHIIIHESGSVQKLNNPTLGSLVDAALNNPSAIIPPLAGAQFNVLQPTTRSNLIVPSKIALTSITPRKIEPYEQLTGLSVDRPEIIMATQFQPLYKRDVKQLEQNTTRFVEESGRNAYVTPAGNYLDAQFQLMHLRADNAIRLLRSARKNEQILHQELHKQTSNVYSALSEVQELADFLTAVLDNVSRLRESFDLQSGFHVIDPSEVVSTHILSFHKRNDQTANKVFDLIKRYLPASYTPAECLIRLGYLQKNVNDVFMSTKIWIQMLDELRRILRNHSLEFVDMDASNQRSDSSSMNITSPSIDYFDIRDVLPSTLSIDALKNLKIVDVAQTLNNIETTYGLLYAGVHFKTEEARLAAIFKLLSNEFRYSVGLSQPGIENLLANKFNFVVNQSENTNLFDSIIGVPGSTIATLNSQPGSIIGFSQRSSGSIVVLPFESQFIESDQGIMLAGGSYYIDELFNINQQAVFNTSRLEQLSQDADERINNLKQIIDAFNIGSHNFVAQNDKSASSISAQLSTPFLLSDYVSLTFIDKNGTPSKLVQNDPVTSLFALAHTNVRIRSILFMLLIAKMSRAYLKGIEFLNADVADDSTPITVDLINRLQETLHQVLPQAPRISALKLTGDTVHVSLSALEAALVADNGLMDVTADLMITVLNAFNSQGKGMIDGKTRFSAFRDTAILMTLFDAICSIASQFGEKSIVGASLGRPSNDRNATGVDYYVIAVKRRATNQAIYSSVISRLEKEEALTRQLVYVAISVLQKLSSAIKVQLGFFNNPMNVAKLANVASTIDDKHFLKLFFTEQQIRLFVAETFDFVARANAGTSTVDSNEVKIIDDSLFSLRVREILDDVFFSRELSSSSASNKRILTIGLPNGLVHRMQQRYVSETAARPEFTNDRRSTTIVVAVHRIDLEHPDIVFNPKRFLFDIATFVVKESSQYLEPIRATTDTNEEMYAIPLRNLGFGSATDIEYAVSRQNDSALRGRKLVFTGRDYEFLNEFERNQMIRNHVMSYLLEIYVKLTTGISVAENVFRMSEPAQKISSTLAANIMKARFSQATKTPEEVQQRGIVFHVNSPKSAPRRQTGLLQPIDDDMTNSSGVHGRAAIPSKVRQTNVKQIASRSLTSNLDIAKIVDDLHVVEHLTHDLKNIQHLQQAMTSVSDVDSLTKQLIVPKQFDRVFNIMIDPNEFDIDVRTMTSTPHGRDALMQGIKQGLIVATTSLSNVRFSPGDSRAEHYKCVDRDFQEGNLIFDKYFVAIETYDELKDES